MLKTKINPFAGSSIYGLRDEEIPSKKEKNIKDIHNIISDEKIYLVHDDTLFGSDKDGMAFGEWGIYWRERFTSPERLSYSAIVESTANKNKKSMVDLIENDEFDEFKMTPIHYMALEGDVIGLRKAYESSGHLIMDDNIFWHNILDLLGLSYDPRFGDNGEMLIDLFKEIRYLIEGDIVYNRIEFLKTGLGDDFLSYNISKEFLGRIDYKERERLKDLRMEELNSRLISSNHFKELKFNLMDLETAEGFLEFFLLYFLIKPPRVELRNYDVENEEFYLLVNGRVKFKIRN